MMAVTRRSFLAHGFAGVGLVGAACLLHGARPMS